MKLVIKIILFILALAFVWGGITLYKLARLASAYAAKTMCSAVFVSKRDPMAVYKNELAAYSYISTQVDTADKTVTASIYGLADRTALYRPGLGATLVIGSTVKELQNQLTMDLSPRPHLQADQLWPFGNRVDSLSIPAQVDRGKLKKALDDAFAEKNPEALRITRGIVVVYKGRLIGERYGDGFTAETPQLGWSMTKSVINTLTGILAGDGVLNIEAPAPIEQWQGRHDPRCHITLHHLLHMASGLEFNETYGATVNDVTYMLFGTADASAYALNKKLAFSIGTHFAYSSGTSNILARTLYNALGKSLPDYWALPRRRLFDRLGITSAVIEPDASGIFVGSSFMYASARDWARLGLLYLQDGVWQGQRILPEGWVRYTVTPDTSAARGEYGAQFWLNAGPAGRPEQRPRPYLPVDLFTMQGHEGQYVWIIPSKQLVVVRLGYTTRAKGWDNKTFLNGILSALQTDNSEGGSL